MWNHILETIFIVITATSELTFNYDDLSGISHHLYHHNPFLVLGTLRYYKMESFHHFRHLLKMFPPLSWYIEIPSGILSELFNLLFPVSSVLLCKFCYFCGSCNAPMIYFMVQKGVLISPSHGTCLCRYQSCHQFVLSIINCHTILPV